MTEKPTTIIITDRDVEPDTDLHPLSWQYLLIWLEYVMTPKAQRQNMSFEKWLDSFKDLVE